MLKKELKRDKVLNFIREAGFSGRKFGEIQRFVCEMNGLDYDEMVFAREWFAPLRYGYGVTVFQEFKRKYRGYWCNNLCGTDGILGQCFRNSSGKYIMLKK